MRASFELKHIIRTILIYIIIIASVADNIALGAGKGVEAKEEATDGVLLVGAPTPLPAVSIEVAFFNVGQGNCTVVKAPNKQDIFIVDAGSSKNPYNIVLTGEAFKKEAVTESIKQWISNSKKESYNIYFIVSHPDIDHKSYVTALLSLFTEEAEEADEEEADEEGGEGKGKKKYECFYYKHPKLEDPSMEKLLEPFLAKGLVVKDFPENKKKVESKGGKRGGKKGGTKGQKKKDKYEYNYIYSEDNFSIGLLNETFPATEDTNDNSVVLLLRFYEHGMLLTGDATAKTFKTMDWNRLAESGAVKNMIFQASHHGAHTDESNSEELIAQIKPHITVFSAPRYSSHRHPSYQVVERISDNYKERKDIIPLNSDKEKKMQYHFFFLDKTIDSSEIVKEQGKFNGASHGVFDPITVYRNSGPEVVRADGLYPAYLTNYPIFHTGSHGTLIFTLTQDKAFVDTYDYPVVKKAAKEPKEFDLKKTTDSVFQNLKKREALIASMPKVPVMPECPSVHMVEEED